MLRSYREIIDSSKKIAGSARLKQLRFFTRCLAARENAVKCEREPRRAGMSASLSPTASPGDPASTRRQGSSSLFQE